ncbi:type II toxin-antitoxin system RelE/ParE family toxin [Methylocystis echinoides]|uniref:Killer protein n=1 Tax=Methylocystis echinoides TaxID=29468 RepID=A0A9W6GTG2_9HYPH|nr:type II toxin-antitoxin system RelE/ParE family toxin [Methylocystis echinoides]GLI92743.1 killer protein [Methylocystis echinoides]
MILSFSCKKTERFFRQGSPAAAWRSIAKIAARKLDMLDAVVVLSDLKAPPGTKLEALERDRKGQHSIRINDQWRVCFVWTEQGPTQVEIVDYH